ncbi:hypothetical protein AMS68_002738 [Peltaster fructicola]|uniref:Cation efflux protein transmembrane domain-containing protein n=1 Tax=Peltaster fructicola TaxID=286661 RepID=A0A6H0XRD8_9PEZI|nr:hypothetical protein AMS68_002738 [Peltaster fructicola]
MGHDGLVNGHQKRSHMGHSHGHHPHDNSLLTSTDKNDPAVRITRIGLFVNLGMAVAKGAGGYYFNSKALQADALHALTDLVSDIMTLATISYSLRPPSPDFPFGYGKVESLGALAVSGILLTGGLAIGGQALIALTQQFFPELSHILSHIPIIGGHGHDHSHGVQDFGPNINAAWLAGGSIIIKEWLYRATMKIAKERRSNVLESNAYHHRVDSLTAIVALVTICASHFFTNAHWLDPIGGLLISGMIVQAGWGNTKSALLELADVAFDKEVQESVSTAAKQAIQAWKGDVDIAGVRGIKSGQNFLVDVEVVAPGEWTLLEQAEVETFLRKKVIGAVRGVHKVAVNFTARTAQQSAPFVDQFANDRKGTQAEMHTHDHDHNDNHEHENHDHDHEKADSVMDDKTAKSNGRH